MSYQQRLEVGDLLGNDFHHWRDVEFLWNFLATSGPRNLESIPEGANEDSFDSFKSKWGDFPQMRNA